jgi:hypothetical protein
MMNRRRGVCEWVGDGGDGGDETTPQCIKMCVCVCVGVWFGVSCAEREAVVVGATTVAKNRNVLAHSVRPH